MTSVDVRPVRPADRAAWLRMRAALWPEAPEDHPGEVDAFLRGASPDTHAVLVAEAAGELVGFAELAVRPFAEGCATRDVGYLEGWFVERAHRGRGVGRALVAAGEAWARARGCTEMASDAAADNELSRRAHAGCGFEDVGLVRCFRKPL